MMHAVGIARDLGADDTGRIAVVLGAVDAADALAVEQFHIERAGRGTVVRTGRMAYPDCGFPEGGMLVHAAKLVSFRGCEQGQRTPCRCPERDDFSPSHNPTLTSCLSTIFSENRFALFGIKL